MVLTLLGFPGTKLGQQGTCALLCTLGGGVDNVWREGAVQLNEQSTLNLCDFMKFTLVYSQCQKRRQEKGRVASKGLLWGSRCLRDCVLILCELLDF